MINTQNPLPKPRQKKKKGTVETVESSKNEDEGWTKYAEPAACRKQRCRRHLRDHVKCDLSLESLKTKSKDAKVINQQLAISHSTSYIPILNTNKNLAQFIWLCCNYSLKYGVNPISDRTINLDPRSIKKEINNLCETYREELIRMITDLLNEEDKHLKMIRETKEPIPLEDRMPKKILIIGLQSDHARVQNKNYGAIDMAIKELNIETMQTKSYALPFQTYQVADRKGKDSESNISHLKEFLLSNLEEHITKIGLCGDGGLVTTKFCQSLQNDRFLAHLALYSGKCVNHAETLQLKWTINRILNDLTLHFKNLFPNRTITKGRKVVFSDEAACKEFRRDFHYFLELIQVQQNYEDDSANIIKFCDQVKALQLECVKNEFEKLDADDKNEALPKLKNPFGHLAIFDFDHYRSEFFNDEIQIKQKIFTVKSTCDTKQRRLPEQFMSMAATANFAQAIIDQGKFNKSFTEGSFVEKETVPRRLSVGFIKKVHELCAAVKYTKSRADSNRDSENMPFIRLVFISVKIACRFDTVGQKLPLSNEFLQ